jgi:hypothetical protein
VLHENALECSSPFPFDDLDPKAPEPDSRIQLFEFARRLVSYIAAQDRCRLTVEALYLALGDADLEGITMTDIAAKHGLTKAAVSKRVKKVRLDLHLPSNANNKSAHAIARYRQTNRSVLRLDKSAPRRVQTSPQRA